MSDRGGVLGALLRAKVRRSGEDSAVRLGWGVRIGRVGGVWISEEMWKTKDEGRRRKDEKGAAPVDK